MAMYKVAQDVEADDKLIGPFSFRQFIYLIIVAIAIALAWGLSQIFVGLAVIPLPIILFFGALALPLRKDQPMEVYLAAIVSFYIKPRRRLWVPDGVLSLVEITAPNVVEVQRIKDISDIEAERRLSYLADIADTRGWAVRHSAQPIAGNSMATDVFFEAQQAVDVLDDNGGVAQSFNTMINQADERRRQNMVAKMHQTAAAPVVQTVAEPLANPVTPIPNAQYSVPAQADIVSTQPDPQLQFNPYPSAIRQSVIQPLDQSDQIQATPPQEQITSNPSLTTSEKPVSPDIISLASNTDLSIETIQREANRIQQKADEDEVFVSLH